VQPINPPPTPRPQRSAPERNSLLASLSRLGVPASVPQLLSMVAAFVVGVVIARALPFIYPILAAPILDAVFGPGISSARDGFNTNFMTACTCCSSTLIALVGAAVFAPRGKRRR
jgi:hypothetical protein